MQLIVGDIAGGNYHDSLKPPTRMDYRVFYNIDVDCALRGAETPHYSGAEPQCLGDHPLGEITNL
jgi:hypothetical protein